jgi:PAS domain S-box-containing protein
MALGGMLLAWCPCVRALDPSLDVSQYAHTAWRINEGFSKGTIYSIAQTPDGYLWLATEFGLLRFDGVRAVPWQPPGDQRLPAGRTTRLLAARDGTLWIGADGGLASWKNGHLSHYLAGQAILALLEDREGVVWAGGGSRTPPNGRLCAIHSGSVRCYGDDGILGHAVYALHEDGKGNLWAGVTDGLWRWKPGPPKFYSLPGELNGIQALAEDTDGALLVGWKGGVYRFVDGKTEAYSPPGFEHPLQNKMLRDRSGGLWIGTRDGLVHVHQARTDVFSPGDGLSGDFVGTLFEDREGNIWVATNGGLDRFRDTAAVTFNVKQGLLNSTVGSILADRDGSVWLSTFGGLNRWERGQITVPATGNAKRDGKLNGSNPNSLFQDDRGRIWVSTSREFGYLENGRFTTIKGIPGGNKPSIAQDTAGNLWVIDTNAGLFRISPQDEVREIPWADLGLKDDASVLATDRTQGGLWIGFFQGGIAYLHDGQVRATYTTTNGLGVGRVNDLQSGDDGALWISTEGGLSRLKNNHIATMTSRNGLPCDAVQWAMEEDDRSLWLYMACGLVRIARSELDAWVADSNRTIQTTVFDSSDGVRGAALSGYHPRVARTPDRRLWFLPGDGVSVIDPHHLHRNELPPPVHVEQIVADRTTYDATPDASGRLRLPPLIRDLEIDYTALSLTAPEKMRFRVKLEGWDRDWKDTGNERKAFYSNLPPRNYRFRVIACNNSGVWNEVGAALDFSIAPAFYQATWFRLGCGAAFLLLLWALYQLRHRQLQRQFTMRLAERARIVEELRKIIDSIPGFVLALSPEGEVELVNRQFLEYFGKTFEEMKDWATNDAIHPDDRPRSVAIFQNSIKTGTPHEVEQRCRRADGVYRWFQRSARPVRGADGGITGWYVLITDIEDRKHAEDELGNLRSELAHMARVTSLGALTASIAHEVSQPLSGIITNASTCLRQLGADPPNLDGALETTRRTIRDGNRATEVIVRLHALFSKKEAKTEVIDLNEAAREVLALCAYDLQRNRVIVRYEFANDLPLVAGDRVQLQQVILNLVRNASDAMSGVQDRPRELVLRTEKDEGDRVRLTVRDSGVGIPEEEMEKLFDSFYTTKSDGMGMGLSVSRSIIERHGGRLWVTPNDGSGVTFAFSIPCKFDHVAGIQTIG